MHRCEISILRMKCSRFRRYSRLLLLYFFPNSTLATGLPSFFFAQMEEDNREILRLLRDNSTQDKLEGLKRLIALSAHRTKIYIPARSKACGVASYLA